MKQTVQAHFQSEGSICLSPPSAIHNISLYDTVANMNRQSDKAPKHWKRAKKKDVCPDDRIMGLIVSAVFCDPPLRLPMKMIMMSIIASQDTKHYYLLYFFP